MRNNKRTILKTFKDYSEFRDADKIIAYLENPEGPTQLNATLRKKLDRYQIVYSLRLRFKTDSHIIGILKEFHGRDERKARYDISETEYIFGKVLKINVDFEQKFLLEASRKNIELAFATKDSNKITKALEAHKKIVGEELDATLLPDFSKFEAHQYNIVVPAQIVTLLQSMLQGGAINFSNLIPAKTLEQTMIEIQEAKEDKDE